ncbi:MAG TPA: dihydrofolate reductase family protein, partial [Gammaproteobacteria bacterium]|nr:dihydrofolate reductase family protein [Gammaproteobacteria bacterium]
EQDARALNPGFVSRMTRGRPWVRSKLAVSLDGRTALADDPALTVRLEGGEAAWRQPLRVVVDSGLRISSQARIFQGAGPCCIATLEADATKQQAFVAAGAVLLNLPAADGRVDLEALMRALAGRECNEVLVEAGPALNGALLQAGLIDELIVYMAPHVLGDTARGMFAIPALAAMDARQELKLIDLRQIGGNLRLIFSVE